MTSHPENFPSPMEAWAACFAAGMSVTEAARARGKAVCTASRAEKKLGVKPVNGYQSEAFRARQRQLMAERWLSPEFVEKVRRARATPKTAEHGGLKNPLAMLTPAQRADYDLLRGKGKMTRAEALESIGRADLIGGAA